MGSFSYDLSLEVVLTMSRKCCVASKKVRLVGLGVGFGAVFNDRGPLRAQISSNRRDSLVGGGFLLLSGGRGMSLPELVEAGWAGGWHGLTICLTGRRRQLRRPLSGLIGALFCRAVSSVFGWSNFN